MRAARRLADHPVNDAEPQQIRRSYVARANAYVVKPMDVDDFMRVVREIEQFYAQIVTGPPFPRREA